METVCKEGAKRSSRCVARFRLVRVIHRERGPLIPLLGAFPCFFLLLSWDEWSGDRGGPVWSARCPGADMHDRLISID